MQKASREGAQFSWIALQLSNLQEEDGAKQMKINTKYHPIRIWFWEVSSTKILRGFKSCWLPWIILHEPCRRNLCAVYISADNKRNGKINKTKASVRAKATSVCTEPCQRSQSKLVTSLFPACGRERLNSCHTTATKWHRDCLMSSCGI